MKIYRICLERIGFQHWTFRFATELAVIFRPNCVARLSGGVTPSNHFSSTSLHISEIVRSSSWVSSRTILPHQYIVRHAASFTRTQKVEHTDRRIALSEY